MENNNLNENVNTEVQEAEVPAVEKKKLSLPVIVGAAVGGVLLVVGIILAVILLGGGEKEEVCPGHVDKDDDLKCDKCSADYDDGEEEPEITKEKCTFTVVDSDGNKLSGAKFTLKLGAVTEELVSDANGVVNVALVAGKYSVVFDHDSLPSGFQQSVFSVEVSADSTSFELLIVNNNPNGTVERPYYISDSETDLSISAGDEIYYNVRGGAGKTLIIKCADVTVNFNGELHEPVDGEIRVYVDSEVDAMNVFSVKNTSESDLEIVIYLESPLGSMDNPIEMTENTVDTEVYAGATKWYKWTAASSGVVLVSSADPKNNISLRNQTTNAVSESTAGSRGEYMMVSAGDVVLVSLAVIGSGDDESVSTKIGFSLTIYAGTAKDPIPVVKNEFNLSFMAGASLTFSTENGGELTISDSEVTVTYNGETYSPSKLGILKVTLEAGAVFTINNTAGASNPIEIKIK